MKITTRFVDSVTEPGRYFDEHGLFLRVEPSGSKRWLQRLTIKGKRREMGLGSAKYISLKAAREQAFNNKRQAKMGGDPLRDQQLNKMMPTFRQAAIAVHEARKPTWRNPKHADQFINTLTTYAFPAIGDLAVSDVSTSDIMRVLTPIWTKKHETAKRLRQRLGVIMKWSIAQGYRQDNPADAISEALPVVKQRAKNRVALPYEDVAHCLDVVRGTDGGKTTKLAIEFLVLTAARSGEVINAAWPEVDLKAATWTIPAERMKAGKEHRVPLSRQAIDILKQASDLSDGSDWVFPSVRGNKPLSDATLRKLIRENGFQVDIHGFRTSFRTWAQEQSNLPSEVVERALAHTIRNKAEAAYARSDLFEKRRKLMEAWANYLVLRSNKIVQMR